MADDTLTQNLPKPLWNHALAAVLIAVLGVTMAFSDTGRSLVEIWWRSDTYAHGMLIAPIAIWLTWKKREQLARFDPNPVYAVFALFSLVALGWVLARLVGVLVIEQLALVAILGLTVWGVLGNQVARTLAFPLLFLFLAVPVGDDLVPPMMEFTASFTVWMLQLTGIPVFREGLHFTIPSASWSVIEACSGIRYLIASVTLGVLYAYLTYQSLWRRLVFVALSMVVPVIANGLRAYMIVMIGHLSDMRLAKGVDHLLYGWVFFGLVMLLLFWVGSFWSEKASDTDAQGRPVATATGRVDAANPARLYLAAGLAVGIVFGCQLLVNLVASRSVDLVEPLSAPNGEAGWVAVHDFELPWSAHLLDSGHRLTQVYRRGNDWIVVDLALFPAQRQDAEAVSSQNAIIHPSNKERRWRISSRWTAERSGTATPSAVNAFNLKWQGGYINRGAVDHLLVWQWYRLGERETAHAYVAKLLAAVNLIYPGRTDGAFVTIATSADQGAEAASALLEQFLTDMGDALTQRIDAAVLGTARP